MTVCLENYLLVGLFSLFSSFSSSSLALLLVSAHARISKSQINNSKKKQMIFIVIDASVFLDNLPCMYAHMLNITIKLGMKRIVRVKFDHF